MEHPGKTPTYSYDPDKQIARDRETWQVDETRTNMIRRMEGNFKPYSPDEETIVLPKPAKVVRVAKSKDGKA